MLNHPACINNKVTGTKGLGSAYSACFLIWLLASGLLLLACQSHPAMKKKLKDVPPVPRDIIVPRWYAELPELPGCQLAHAHSGVYIDKNRQKEALLQSGAANLAKSSKVKLEVGWAATQDSRASGTASYIKEEEWENRAADLKEKIEILKEYRLNNSVLALVGNCPGNSNLESLSAALDDSLINVSTKQPPAWVSNPMQVAGQYFGVGTAANHTTAAKAWHEAERQARADLAFRMAIEYQSLESNIEQINLAGVRHKSETRAKLTLENLQVIRHAYSHYGNTFYALIRMPATAP